MRQEIADNPLSGELTEQETAINLAHYHLRLAKAELALGDSLAAREQIKKTIGLRKAWVDASPGEPVARSYLMEAYVWQGVAAAPWVTTRDRVTLSPRHGRLASI